MRSVIAHEFCPNTPCYFIIRIKFAYEFCRAYCEPKHSRMHGRVIPVCEPPHILDKCPFLCTKPFHKVPSPCGVPQSIRTVHGESHFHHRVICHFDVFLLLAEYIRFYRGLTTTNSPSSPKNRLCTSAR